MNYLKIYNDIISSRIKSNRFKGDGNYYEKHHITPKCLGGTNDKDNMVLLTAKEHFICHYLLCKIYQNNSKIICAFWLMCNMKTNLQQRHIPSSRAYQFARECLSNAEYSTERKNKVSKALTGIKRSKETIEKISKSKLGKRSLFKGIKGKKHLDKTKILISDGNKGVKHNTFIRKGYIEIYKNDGTFVTKTISQKDATKITKLGTDAISGFLTGKYKTNRKGFIFKYENDPTPIQNLIYVKTPKVIKTSTNKKKTEVYDLKTNELIGVYNGLNEACRNIDLNLDFRLASLVAKGIRKHHKGYVFKYIN